MIVVVSKVASGSPKNPVTYTFPHLSIAIPAPSSDEVPPALSAHNQLPLVSNLATNISFPPDDVKVVDPNVAFGSLKNPVTYTFPHLSTAIPNPVSSNGAPSALTTHNHVPLVSNLATNISKSPNDVKVIDPNVAIPENRPVT